MEGLMAGFRNGTRAMDAMTETGEKLLLSFFDPFFCPPQNAAFNLLKTKAKVAELADAPDLGSRKDLFALFAAICLA
jgi:hypothetical protein